ncbi:hypothetical protein EYF80_055386 [Liparis tanakae]|uniref:Uncharacterized protein n=1 Tax=Liparis tanakae TaxID=230148 RepID=A0A4Z2F001_9TELE|nr:hypothetical protein EYF80_055386 [Liparis tanakae]
MSKVQMLRRLVNQRLAAAAEEICGLFERTIAEYEEELSSSKEENERLPKLEEAVFNPEVRLQRADVQQLLVVKEEVLSEQQVWISSLDQVHPEPSHVKEEQEDPEPPHIKEEQEELWTNQEGEQLQGLEEAGFKFSFTPVKSEAEEKAQSSQKLMEMIVEDQNQPGTQIQIDRQILMRRLETLLNQILLGRLETLLNQILMRKLESLQNQIRMTLFIGRRPENLNQV